MMKPEESPDVNDYDNADLIGSKFTGGGCTFRHRQRRWKGGLDCWEKLPNNGEGKKGWLKKLKRVFKRRSGKSRAIGGRFGYDPISYALNFEKIDNDGSLRRHLSAKWSVGLGRENGRCLFVT